MVVAGKQMRFVLYTAVALITLSMVNLASAALGIPSIYPANPSIDTGQSILINSSWSGGTAPYNAVWYTGPSGNTCSQDSANVLATYNGLSTAINSISVSPTTTNSYCIIVEDSESPQVTQSSSNDVITVYPDLSVPSITPSNPAIDSGQQITFTASWSGGTPTYGASLYSSPTATCNQQSTLVQQDIGLSSTSVTFSAVSPASTTYYCVFVTDNSIYAYSTGSTTSYGNALYGVTFAPSGTYAYMANCNSGNNELNGFTNCGASGPDNIMIINTATNTVVNSINSGFEGPFGIAFAPSGTYAYVTNSGSNSISIINTATNTVISSITSGFLYPKGVAISPDGSYAYVANEHNNNVVIINTATNTVVNSITTGFSKPVGVAFSPSGKYAYVTNFNAYNVVVINTATNTVVSSLTVDPGASINFPDGVSFSPSGTYAYMSVFNGYAIDIIDTATNTVVDSIYPPTQDNPGGVGISPSGPYAYFTNVYTDTLTLVDTGVPTTNSITSKVTVNPVLSTPTITPSNLAIASGQPITFTASWSGGTPTYGASLYSSSTSTCNQQSTLVQQDIGLSTSLVTFSPVIPSQQTYYCVFVTDNTLNLESIANTINLGTGHPTGVAFSPSGTYAYVANCGGYCISGPNANIMVINTATNTIANIITLGPHYRPTGVAFSPDGSYAYVTNSGNSYNISVINTATNTVVNTITSGFDNPQGVAFSPSGTYAYVANYGSNNVVIINTTTNTVVNSISSGINGPVDVAFSPDGSYAYVSNPPSTNMVIINTATNTVIGSVNSPYYIGPQYISFSPSGTYAYATDTGRNPNQLDIIYTATNSVISQTQNQSYSDNIGGVAISPSGTYAYVASTSYDNVLVINTNVNFANSINSEVTLKSSGPQVSNPYAGGPTGYFGPNSTLTSSTTSITSSSSTSTILPVTTITQIIASPGTTKACDDTSGYTINYPSLNATVKIAPGINGCFSVNVTNSTLQSKTLNRSVITALNYTVNNTNVSADAIVHYPCSIPDSDVAPFILRNGTWKEVTPFTLDATTCTVEFAVPPDPVIALLNTNVTSTITTTAATTAVQTSTAVPVTSVPTNTGMILEILIIVIIIIIAVALFLYFRQRR